MKKTPLQRKPTTLVRKPIERKSGIGLKGSKLARTARKGKKTKKSPKTDIYRKWGLPESMIRGGGLKSWIRYTSLPEKGCYWYHFSLFVRRRDVEKYGTCISCGRPITVETSQAGHFAPAADCGLDLLFDPLNVNAECPHCNAWDDMHLIGYAKNLDLRYGEGTADILREKRRCKKENIPYPDGTLPTTREFKAEHYEQKMRELGIEPKSVDNPLQGEEKDLQ